MIDKFDAAILYETGKPLKVESITVPKLGFGQVLVKIFYSGVCRSQLMEVRGGRGVDKWLPHLLGHEASGEVVAVGDGVSKVKIGDEVILTWISSEGADAAGAKYQKDGKTINSGKVSTFSNYSIVSENRIVLKPKNLSFKSAALFGCALPTGAGMVLNELKPPKDSTVIALGLGGIGLSALITMASLGIKNIIAIDLNEEKLAYAKSIGVNHVLNSTDPQLKEKIMSLTDGSGADFCIESAGSVKTIELGFSLIHKSRGVLYFASHPPEGEYISIAPHDLICGKKIFGSWGGGTVPDRDIPIISDLLQLSKIDLNPLISKEYSLQNVNEALIDLELGKVFRPLLKMSH